MTMVAQNALIELLISKGVITDEEIQEAVQAEIARLSKEEV
jgi:hypothetical protein